MNLVALPAFTDNYIWMFHDGSRAAVVDPGDQAPVLAALDRLGLELQTILVTHHHRDHVGGLDALRSRLTGAVYGPARESIPAPFEPLNGGDRIEVLGCALRVIDVPGHTAGHIAFHREGPDAPSWLFCGDTLFSAGCGRLFEGTPAQMTDSLASLAALPAETLVCCAHEYTTSNLRFAQTVEPGNPAVTRHIERCRQLRSQGLPTLPSTLGLELQINPFLRCTQPEVVASALAQGATSTDPVAVLASLREWKNRFQ